MTPTRATMDAGQMDTCHMDTRKLQLLDRIARRLADEGVDEAMRHAVTVLTADADPRRADRLAVGPDERPVLVERLAAWAVRRASDRAVDHARAVLDGTPVTATASDAHAAHDASPGPVLVPCG